MNDIENALFTLIKNKLSNTIYVTSEYSLVPEKFPCVYIQETDNYTKVMDGSNHERVSTITYQIDVFTKGDGKKSSAKTILKTIDDLLIDMGFKRISSSSVPNIDTTIFRKTARYQASIIGNTIYRS